MTIWIALTFVAGMLAGMVVMAAIVTQRILQYYRAILECHREIVRMRDAVSEALKPPTPPPQVITFAAPGREEIRH